LVECERRARGGVKEKIPSSELALRGEERRGVGLSTRAEDRRWSKKEKGRGGGKKRKEKKDSLRHLITFKSS